MVDQLSMHSRRTMLREVLIHQEAATRNEWAFPPLAPGPNEASYEDMLLDPAVAYCVNLIKEAVLANGYEIEPADASAAAAAMAIAIEDNLADLDTPAILSDGLSAIWRGFWCHEIDWKYGQRRYWLEDLASIHPDQVALELDDKMRVTAIISRPLTGAGAQQRIDAGKLWMHIHKPGRTRPAGESILEPSFRAYSSKNRLLQFWGLSIQRFGVAQWMLQIPENTPPARQTQILSTFYAGRLDGVYLVPDSVQATLINPPQWANMLFEQALDYQDSEIIKAIIMVHAPGGGHGRTYVTGDGLSVQARSTAYRLSSISDELVRSFNRQVIQPLCMANWRAAPAQCPRLRLPVPDASRIVQLAAAVAQLRTAGIVDPDVAAEQLGLPEPTISAPTPATTEKSGQKGN